MKTFEQYLESTGEVGVVEQVFPSLVFVTGLPSVKPQELVLFETGDYGHVMSLRPGHAEVLLFSDEGVRIGMQVARTDELYQIRVGNGMLGHVIDPLGRPQEKGFDSIEGFEPRVADAMPPELGVRDLVTEAFDTGVTVVDLVIPLGKGQRELVIGDRKIGKTAFLKQAAIAHVLRGGICVYGAVAKRTHEITSLVNFATKQNISERLVIVASNSRDSAGLIFQTPYSAMAVAEYFRDQGEDVLLVLDDLTIHAKHYREITLLAKRFPGRSAYPGDVFYIHARLMERAGNFQTGSITCLPVAETVLGDISGYIQTNLMSMTDGHIFFDTELYNAGRRPAVNSFLSVTRVGHQAQSPLYKSLSQELSKFLSKYRQTEELLHFGGELGDEAKQVLSLGAKVQVLFNQAADTVVSKHITAVILAALWAGLWSSDDEHAFQQRYVTLASAYASNEAFRQQVETFIAQSENFQRLIDTVQSNEGVLTG